jgi:CHASE3 domain sensor protein
LILSVGFLFLIVVHFSWEFSRSEERIRTLAEDLALLRAAHEELTEQLRNQTSGPSSADADADAGSEP